LNQNSRDIYKTPVLYFTAAVQRRWAIARPFSQSARSSELAAVTVRYKRSKRPQNYHFISSMHKYRFHTKIHNKTDRTDQHRTGINADGTMVRGRRCLGIEQPDRCY